MAEGLRRVRWALDRRGWWEIGHDCRSFESGGVAVGSQLLVVHCSFYGSEMAVAALLRPLLRRDQTAAVMLGLSSIVHRTSVLSSLEMFDWTQSQLGILEDSRKLRDYCRVWQLADG